MKEFFADFHIHIGWTEENEPVKISGSKNLTFYNILYESYHRKGLDMIGIVDSHSPVVQKEIERYLTRGIIKEYNEGGLLYKDLTIILGSEIEIKEEGRGPAHYLTYFPFYREMVEFSKWMHNLMKNPNLSSQRLYISTKKLQEKVKEMGGLFIPAHIFTPHKSLYGNCCDHMEEIIDPSLIDAVELGLSSDSELADQITELHLIPFLSNSDAHSLQKIGREYNKLLLYNPSFKEFELALTNNNGRKILANYGLNPRLGKYYNNLCLNCNKIVDSNICPECNSKKIVKGVANRIAELATYDEGIHPNDRPPYIHQIPLEFFPKIGPKTLENLLDNFGTEMNVMHKISETALKSVVHEDIAKMIIKARTGTLQVEKGGGGIYGKVLI